MKTNLLISAFASLSILAGCMTRHSSRVEAVYALAATDPEAALDSISQIDPRHLSNPDRMLFRLAAIKATDKACRELPGDSAILPLVDYYSAHETDRFYPEALYYAGRIYCDSGDAPTALRYFQDALDLLPETTSQLILRACVISQTAGALRQLHMLDEARPCYEEVLRCDSLLNDTVSLMYDLADYAESLRWADECDKALPLLDKALQIAVDIDSDFLPVIKFYLARIQLKQGKYKEALENLIPQLDKVEWIYRKHAMSSAIMAYYNNGLYDSAFNMAQRVLELNIPDYIRRNAYFYLIQDEMLKFSSDDSLRSYKDKYLAISERIYKKYTDQSPIIQRAFYNYSVHERERKKAEDKRNQTTLVLFLVLIVTLVFVIMFLIYKNKAKTNRIKLHEALEYIREQRSLMSGLENKDAAGAGDRAFEKTESDIRNTLRRQYIENASSGDGLILPESLINSVAFKTMRTHLAQGSGIPESNRAWSSFEKRFDKEFPNFRFIIERLAGKPVKSQEYITLMLIKCGFKPSEIATLIFRAKSAVSSRRAELSRKLFGQEVEPKLFYDIIRGI
ncbi:MAG: tetratricopeptide repeat protein [Paramuribaculum sp.]|nr:tetratricopeptide repeat protein [Paramuribaculum sp.]